MLMLMQVAEGAGTIIGELLQQYGITGAGLGLLLMLMMRQNKSAQLRIENLEKQQVKQHQAHLESQKDMIDEYVDLVKNKTRVLADLTGCLRAMKDTLDRLDRNS